jgi:Type II secretion system (T2SS), protein M subtype b
MTPSRSEQQRERLVVSGGAVIATVALLVVYGMLPLWRHFQTRELQIAAARERAGLYAGYTAGTRDLERAADADERWLAASPRRALHTTEAPLAASALQTLLQDAAEGAGMAVTRVEVEPESDSTSAVRGTLTAVGDIHGLAALLRTLETGARLVQVERFAVQQNSALRGAPDVLQLSLSVRAPVILDGRTR